MFTKLKRDLDAILERDPAAGSRIAAVFLYPSFQVMLAYRIANPLWRAGYPVPRAVHHAVRALVHRH